MQIDKKILVVGATGFVGPALVEEFSNAGYSVICGVRNLASAARQLSFPNVEFMKVNLNEDLDPDVWLERLEEHEVDGVVNNVGIANSFGGQSLENVNVLAPLALFKAVQHYCQDNRSFRGKPHDIPVIQISTTGANWPDCDKYEYPRTKKQIDEVLVQTDGLRFIIVRPNIIYEPGRGHLLLEEIARLSIIAYIGGSDIQPIHCRELAIGIVRLMKNPSVANRSILQAVGPEVMTWEKVFKSVCNALGRKHCIFMRFPLLIGQLFTSISQKLPDNSLGNLGVLAKMDDQTIEMMTKGSTGDNSEWLKKTQLEPITLFNSYKKFGKSRDTYNKYIQDIREKITDYS
ncbi:MAG: NAD-dependent epimerase/dehydratase family protein [Desulfobulbaceae bacterium]|nr:NAD-dependent epimerase/dehydratase family protein [Desulfobulbaceae bacterium]